MRGHAKRICTTTRMCLIFLLALLIAGEAAPSFCAELDAFEPDDSPEQASIFHMNVTPPQRHNSHREGDEDWIQFIALEGDPFDVIASNKAGDCMGGVCVRLELYDSPDPAAEPIMWEDLADENGEVTITLWSCPRSGTYYVRAVQSDPSIFGEGTEYDLWVSAGQMPGTGSLAGKISDARSGKPAAGVRISMKVKPDPFFYYNSHNGSYRLRCASGAYLLKIEADGYKPWSGNTKVVDFITTPKDFLLSPLSESDLVITAISGPAKAKAGQSISVASTVKNQGKATAKAFSVGIYLSKDRTIKPQSDRCIGSRKVLKLGAGASSKAITQAKVPTRMVPGVYYLGAVADYGRVVAESDEHNNALASKTRIVVE